VQVTDWFKPPIKPVRPGEYEAAEYDCGWLYEWRVWFDGVIWRDRQDGWALTNQNVTWRGLTTEQTA
jgi:hypothetical protein